MQKEKVLSNHSSKTPGCSSFLFKNLYSNQLMHLTVSIIPGTKKVCFTHPISLDGNREHTITDVNLTVVFHVSCSQSYCRVLNICNFC